MKKIEMLFYKTDPSEKNTGMKMVLWEVTTDKGKIIYDWGFCDWLGSEWDLNLNLSEMPKGYSANVIFWSNTIDPKILLKEDSRIIKLG